MSYRKYITTQRNNMTFINQEGDHFQNMESKELARHKARINCILLYTISTIIALFCIALIITFFVIPVIFAYSVDIQRLVLFSNFGLDNDPEDFRRHSRCPELRLNNFYIKFQDSANQTISLGVWHMLPYSLYPNYTSPSTNSSTESGKVCENLIREQIKRLNDSSDVEIDVEDKLRENLLDVIVYFHGSGETRQDGICMFAVLLNYFHVIAFDYRDYGDSTPAILSERDVAQDNVHVINWIRERTSKRIYIWAHSLGTALSTLTISLLPHNLKPHGLVLESAFTSMRDEIAVHLYGKYFAWLPWFRQTVQDPLRQNGFLFDTRNYILSVDCPILILHSEDDSIIPINLGRKLARIASNKRTPSQGNVTFVQFAENLGYDHFRIYASKKLLQLIPNFMTICDDFYNKTHPVQL